MDSKIKNGYNKKGDKMKKVFIPLIIIFFLLGSFILFKKEDVPIKNSDIKKVKENIKSINYSDYKVNELGNIPVMMYHGIVNGKSNYIGGNVDKDGYQRTVKAFKEDLEFYYQNNYQMIRLDDYIDGIIKTDLGKSPIVLTFDDGLSNNVRFENGKLDPNSALGILESFKKKYPDFNVTATFFINSTLFNQDDNSKVIDYLITHGYDIGNHTYNHLDISNLTVKQTEKEVGMMYDLLSKYTDKYVNIVALPYGSPYSKDHQNFSKILKGNYKKNYVTKATLRVGWESDLSPFNKDFDKSFIKRIRAYDNNGKDFDIKMNFDILEKNRYISDGDYKKVVVKNKDKNKVKTNLEIITY